MDEQTMQTKSKKKVVLIIAAVAAVLIVGFVLFFFLVLRSNKRLIVGTWEQEAGNDFINIGYITFNKNGTVSNPLDETNSALFQYSVNGDDLMIRSEYFKIAKLTNSTLVLQKIDGYGEIGTLYFTRQTSDKVLLEVREKYNEEHQYKKANSIAKLAFTTILNEADELMKDGDYVTALKTHGAVPVSSFRKSSDPLKKAVYEALIDEENMGYVYIDYDPNDGNAEYFVQWSASEDGDIIGQFPDAPKTVEQAQKLTFGTHTKY